MDEKALTGYRKILEQEFAEIGKKHGLNLEFRNITYDAYGFRFTLNCTENSPEAVKKIQEKNIFALKSLCHRERIAESSIEKLANVYSLTFKDRGREYEFHSFNRGSFKFPVVLKEVNSPGRQMGVSLKYFIWLLEAVVLEKGVTS